MQLRDKINPKHTAILVIDIQDDFVNPEGILAKRGRNMSMINDVVEKLPTFLEQAKSLGVLTLYTQQIYDYDKLNPLQKEQYDLDNKFVTCDKDTDGWKLYGITPGENDVYVKYNYNVFSNPDLIKRLEENDIKTLVIVGVDTVYCLETAIRNGYDLGYKIVVPEDLVAGNAKHIEMHNNTLIHVKKNYGVVSSSQEILDIWN